MTTESKIETKIEQDRVPFQKCMLFQDRILFQDSKYSKCISTLMKKIQDRTKNLLDGILKKIGTSQVKANYILELKGHVSSEMLSALEELYERKIEQQNIGESYFLIFQPNREEKLELLEQQVQQLQSENKSLRKRRRLGDN